MDRLIIWLGDNMPADDGKVSLEEILYKMDGDDNGHISLEEFLTAALPQIIRRKPSLMHDLAAQAIVDVASEKRAEVMADAKQAAEHAEEVA